MISITDMSYKIASANMQIQKTDINGSLKKNYEKLSPHIIIQHSISKHNTSFEQTSKANQ